MCGETDFFGAAHTQFQDLQGLALVQDFKHQLVAIQAWALNACVFDKKNMAIAIVEHVDPPNTGTLIVQPCVHPHSHVSGTAAAMTGEIRRVIKPFHTKKYCDGSKKKCRSL